MPPLPEEIRPYSEVRFRCVGEEDRWRPVSVSLPLYIRGVLPPKPDLGDPLTACMGAVKRVVNPLTPEMDLDKILDFGKFVREVILREFEPLNSAADVSFETWIESTNYPLARKEELRAVNKIMDPATILKEHVECASFLKDEWYPEFKYGRTINPRDDHFKVFSGPIFKLIEKVVFEKSCFIKKVPISQRAAYIAQHVLCPGATYVLTDYSSFESSFTAPLMRNCEMLLYKHMTQNLPEGRRWFSTVQRALTGSQLLRFGKGRVTTRATRMSGDMCTSLGNGFTNYCLMRYAAHVLELGSVHGVFEGDDGLCRFSSGKHPDASFFSSLGFTVKMQTTADAQMASFCGMIFDPESRQQVGDPFSFLATIGWTSARYAGASRKVLLALLRSKAMSAAHQWVGCPIIGAVCKRILHLTAGFSIRKVIESRNTDFWTRERLLSIVDQRVPYEEPTMATRLLFEKVYGVDCQTQIRIENEAATWTLGVVSVDMDFPELWKGVWADYVCQISQTGLRDPAFAARYRQRPRSNRLDLIGEREEWAWELVF